MPEHAEQLQGTVLAQKLVFKKKKQAFGLFENMRY